LGINSFNQPNVQSAKDMTDKVIAEYSKTGKIPTLQPDAVDGQLATFGSKSNTVSDALLALTDQAQANKSYFAILAYMPPSAAADQLFSEIRDVIRAQRQIATTAGYGPRFQHSTGQLHKGGPGTGIFLQITTDAPTHLTIPDAKYDFSTLIWAQATGDLQALNKLGRPTLRIHIQDDPIEGLQQLLELVKGEV
jgi:transaldolase/glucose-6-phosphate isomerase